MARGWESKSVESQIQDAEEESEISGLSREEIDLRAQRISIERSLSRVEHDLEETKSEVRRRSLRHAKDHLEKELEKLSS